MRKKLLILIISIIGMLGLSSCETLCYTTPVYYESCPTVIYRTYPIYRNYPPPPPPRHYHHKPHHRPHTPPPPRGGRR